MRDDTMSPSKGPELMMFTQPAFDLFPKVGAKIELMSCDDGERSVKELPTVTEAVLEAGPDFFLDKHYASAMLEDFDAEGELKEMFKSLEALEKDPVHEPVKISKAKPLKIKREKVEAVQGNREQCAKQQQEWLSPNVQFQKEVAEGGHNPSKAQNNWALRRLQKYRQHVGDDLAVDFVDMTANQQVMLLCNFFEQVTKTNGELYPMQTTMQLLDLLNRVLRRHQEERMIRTRVQEPPFHIKSAPLFKRLGVAVCAAMRRARDAGANKKRKKSKVMTCNSEVEVLASPCMQKGFSRGLEYNTLYFTTFRFRVRGGKELHKVKTLDISIGSDMRGKFVRYDERLSKNYKVDMQNFREEDFWPPVSCYDADVVDTFEQYLRHLPEGVECLFCSPIDGPKGLQWYYSTPMGMKTLTNFTQWVCGELGLDCKEFTNKSERTTMITRMSERGVPNCVGMLISGHKTEGAYKRYDQTTEVKVRAAQRCCGLEDITYDDALKEEMDFMKLHEINGSHTETDETSHEKKLKLVDELANNLAAMSGLQGAASSNTMPTTMAVEMLIDENSECETPVQKKTSLKEDLEWMENFDWAADFNEWEGSKNLIVNPIKAMLGKLSGCSVLITFNGVVNLCNK